jgi:hypothetical protein
MVLNVWTFAVVQIEIPMAISKVTISKVLKNV